MSIKRTIFKKKNIYEPQCFSNPWLKSFQEMYLTDGLYNTT